ncbi:MAG: phosphotransferase [Desulfoprunum sp.]|nr:phosphotransferase [Desulfoprunum sp.]
MEDHLIESLIPLLEQSGLIRTNETDPAGLSSTVLGADGSSRCFVRLHRDGRPLCLAVFPAIPEGRDLAEAGAAWHIGRHLMHKEIPVPALYGRHEESGVILFEDLGDTRLHERVAATDFADPSATAGLLRFYEEAIEQLLAMQIDAAQGFDKAWCWDTPCYDRQLMLERESGYFLRAFWQEMLGCRIPAGIEDEFRAIASQAAEVPAGFFLHRDFQSRNIMITDDHIRIIDFQGGRRGPLAYDLASLLIDPYAALPGAIQERLLHFYLEQLGHRMTIDAKAFRRQYTLFALQRNLQIVGAFAFLSQVRGKAFFAEYIRPAVAMLSSRLQEPIFHQQSVLRKTVELAVEELS